MAKSENVLAAMEEKLPKGWIACHKHCACACLFESKEYPSGCPFCKSQHLINPKLMETSPYKNGGVRTDEDELGEIEAEK